MDPVTDRQSGTDKCSCHVFPNYKEVVYPCKEIELSNSPKRGDEMIRKPRRTCIFQVNRSLCRNATVGQNNVKRHRTWEITYIGAILDGVCALVNVSGGVLK